MRFIDRKIKQRGFWLRLSNIGYVLTETGLILFRLLKYNSYVPDLALWIILYCSGCLLLLAIIFTVKFEKACEAIDGYNEALKAFHLKESYEESDLD